MGRAPLVVHLVHRPVEVSTGHRGEHALTFAVGVEQVNRPVLTSVPDLAEGVQWLTADDLARLAEDLQDGLIRRVDSDADPRLALGIMERHAHAAVAVPPREHPGGLELTRFGGDLRAW